MQTLIQKFPFAEADTNSNIFNMVSATLAGLPFHENTPAITRYIAKGFPVQVAVHEVSPLIVPPREYTMPHLHNDTDEINIIISHHDLLYAIQVGDEKYTVSNNACIWIPKGTLHAANVLRGSGHFISIRFN